MWETGDEVKQDGVLPNVVAVDVNKKYILITCSLLLVLIILLAIFGQKIFRLPLTKRAPRENQSDSPQPAVEEPWWKKNPRDLGQDTWEKSRYRLPTNDPGEKMIRGLDRQIQEEKDLENRMKAKEQMDRLKEQRQKW